MVFLLWLVEGLPVCVLNLLSSLHNLAGLTNLSSVVFVHDPMDECVRLQLGWVGPG